MSVVINGTTGVTFPNGVTMASGTSSPVTVAQGGTGATSLTANNVLLGNGTSALQAVAPGTSGNVLTSNGTTWTSTAPSGGVTSWNGVTGAVTSTAAYDIGSFITGRPANTSSYAVSSTIAGSSLYSTPAGVGRRSDGNWTYNNTGIVTAGTALINTGSWRCVSGAGTDDNGYGLCGLWVRYA